MEFEVKLKSGETEQVTALTYRQKIPCYEFYVAEQRGGRKVESLVRRYQIDDVAKITVV